MPRRFYIALLALVIAIAGVSCTDEPAPSFEPSPSAAPTAVTSPSVEPTAVISPSESPSPTPEPMSYEEYFGTVREITVDNDEGGHIFDVDYADVAKGKYQTGWYEDGDKMYRLADDLMISDGVTTYYSYSGELVYLKDKREIYITEDGGNHSRLLYQSPDADVECLCGDNMVVFFTTGSEIWRIYAPDGTVDFMCDTYYDVSDEIYQPWKEQGLNEKVTNFGVISNHDITFMVRHSKMYESTAKQLGKSGVIELIESDAIVFGDDAYYSSWSGKTFASEAALELLKIPADRRFNSHEEYRAYLESFGIVDHMLVRF